MLYSHLCMEYVDVTSSAVECIRILLLLLLLFLLCIDLLRLEGFGRLENPVTLDLRHGAPCTSQYAMYFG
jgi:hypothetical protein